MPLHVAVRRNIVSPESLPIAPMKRTERRSAARHDYDGMVGLLLDDTREAGARPMILRAGDISAGGLRVTSRHPLPLNRRGVMQLVRAHRRQAVIGVEVRHCRYLQDGAHEAGLQFVPVPKRMDLSAFRKADGSLRLLDALLEENMHR